jgi:hypothetical protein
VWDNFILHCNLSINVRKHRQQSRRFTLRIERTRSSFQHCSSFFKNGIPDHLTRRVLVGSFSYRVIFDPWFQNAQDREHRDTRLSTAGLCCYACTTIFRSCVCFYLCNSVDLANFTCCPVFVSTSVTRWISPTLPAVLSLSLPL